MCVCVVGGLVGGVFDFTCMHRSVPTWAEDYKHCVEIKHLWYRAIGSVGLDTSNYRYHWVSQEDLKVHAILP